MKKVAFLGFVLLMFSFVYIVESNRSLTIFQELATESAIESESTEDKLDNPLVFVAKNIEAHFLETNASHSYAHPFITFNVSKGLFRPPILA
jgi:hypothetical protein